MKHYQVRIIGGRWRGRQLHFPKDAIIRPSPDRVRETLFNWLMNDINGARCLDCFSGSGALGFEALSRGAHGVVLLDQDPLVLQALEQSKAMLHAANAHIQKAHLPKDLALFRDNYDIVFLDPPFGKGLIGACCLALHQYQCVQANGLVYLETELNAAELELELPPSWECLKQNKAGRVHFYLYRVLYKNA